MAIRQLTEQPRLSDLLGAGDQLWFSTEVGDEGPQASTVLIVGKHRLVDR